MSGVLTETGGKGISIILLIWVLIFIFLFMIWMVMEGGFEKNQEPEFDNIGQCWNYWILMQEREELENEF